MNHIDEDILLKYTLELIENKEELAEIETHLVDCPECRALLQKIHSDMDIIGGLEPQAKGFRMPVRKSGKNIYYSTKRAAALIILGIGIGYWGANLTDKKEITITSSYAVLSPPADSTIGLAVSDATQVINIR